MICGSNNVVEHYGKRIKILHGCPFSIMFYFIICTPYQKIGDLFCPVIYLDFRTVHLDVLFTKCLWTRKNPSPNWNIFFCCKKKWGSSKSVQIRKFKKHTFYEPKVRHFIVIVLSCSKKLLCRARLFGFVLLKLFYLYLSTISEVVKDQ